MDKIEFLRKGREKYEILVVTRHVQGEEQKREGASASSFFCMKKATKRQLSSREVSKVGLASPKRNICDRGATSHEATRTI